MPRQARLSSLPVAAALLLVAWALTAFTSAAQARPARHHSGHAAGAARSHHGRTRHHQTHGAQAASLRRRVVAPVTTVPPVTLSIKPILWGALIGSQLTGSQPPWDWNAVTAFQNLNAGKKPVSVLHWGSQWYSPTYCSYGSGYCTFPTSVFSSVRSTGTIPFFSWSSTSDSGPSGFTDAEIAAGSQDAYITQWAQAAKAWGHPFFLRLDWEQNGSWFPWGVGAGGTTASDYVAMWRHVHDIFTQVGATNVSWVWCPNIDPGHSWAPLASLYPGDAYVDWTGLDGYNANAPWTSFHDLFLSTYNQITATIAPSKPMIVGETASTEVGGSKAQWITDMLRGLPISFPKIRGVLWYDRSDGPINGHADWPVESSTASQAAFASGLNSPTYTVNSYANLATSGPILPPV